MNTNEFPLFLPQPQTIYLITSGTTRPLLLASLLLVLHVLRNGFQEDLANNLSRKVQLTACHYLDPPSLPFLMRGVITAFSQKLGFFPHCHQLPNTPVSGLAMTLASSPRIGCIPTASMPSCTSSVFRFLPTYCGQNFTPSNRIRALGSLRANPH